MYKQLILFVILGLLYIDVQAQVDSTNKKAVELSKKHLTYYWVERNCPHFENTEYRYGFKIKCAGCIMTKSIKRNNSKVERIINRSYGRNWFASIFH